jgi:hypothetical protein
LDSEFAVSNAASLSEKYIQDTSLRPFSNNIAKIDQIYDTNGNVVTFNSTDQSADIMLLDYRTLYLKNPVDFVTYTLVCRALPEAIILPNEIALETYQLNLPPQYLEALLLYAAGRVYANRGAENATNNESAIFFARFEQACMNIHQFGLNDKEELTGTRFGLRGFV